MPEDVTVIEMRLYLCKTRPDPKYFLDSLYNWLGVELQGPYIHVILFYIVSIKWYIIQPLVRLLLHITNLQLVWYHLHRYELCNDPIQFLLGMFGLQSEYISPYSISTLPLNQTMIVQCWTWIVPLWRLARTSWTDWLDCLYQQHGKVLWPYFHTVPKWSGVECLYVWFDVWLLDLPWGILLDCLSIMESVLGWETLFLCWRI